MQKNIFGQVYVHDRHLPEFEVKFEHWNVLHQKYIEKIDIFRCSSEQQANTLLRQKYGSLVDVIYIIPFE